MSGALEPILQRFDGRADEIDLGVLVRLARLGAAKRDPHAGQGRRLGIARVACHMRFFAELIDAQAGDLTATTAA